MNAVMMPSELPAELSDKLPIEPPAELSNKPSNKLPIEPPAELSNKLPDELAARRSPATEVPPIDSPVASPLEASLTRRLAEAKASLDRLEQDPHSRDHSALAAARVELTLAARALADALIACGCHVGPSASHPSP